uniref:Zinc finger protein OZF n=2 Tax=Lygus hesperus TaxID=30085 RepID=A0A146KPP4_LYGHE
MTGYRRVNYYELCRLCTSNEGIKLPIFKDEGRSRQLSSKIQICLRLQISEADSLPKYICSVCLEKLECCFEFRTSCVSAEVMLQSYATALKNNVDFQREGMVYIKENKLDDMEEQETHELKNDELTAVGEEEQVSHHPGLPLHLDSFASLVEAATIQIIPDIHDPPRPSGILEQELNSFQEVVQQSEDDQDGSETSNHTLALPGTTGHEVLLLHCGDPKQKDDSREGPTILGPLEPEDDEDERTTIHMEEFLKLKCSDINKNHSEEEEFQIMFETKVRRLENEEHTTKATFQCDTCTKTFKRKEHLYQHKKLHTGERPFKCAHCVRTFSRKEHLVRHAHSHTGQKLFNCDVCGKSFSRKDNVRKHRKTHETTGPYSCEFCGMQFNVRPYYIMHKNKHKDGSCVLEVKKVDVEESITYEVQEESPDVHSNESNSFQQVTSSTSTSILEKALTQEG